MDDATAIETSPLLEVPARRIPSPKSISTALRRSIDAAVVLPRDRMAQAPRTNEDWRAFAAVSDAETLKGLPAMLARFPATISVGEIAGVTVRRVVPASVDPARTDRAHMHLHGGGYVINGGEASIPEAILTAHYTRTPVVSVDYRMPPDHPFPAAVDDAVAVWKTLIATHAPASMGVFGASAGGGLTLAMTLKLKALGLPLPGALAPGTPWADLAGESDSYATNAGVDSVFTQYQGVAAGMARLYAGGASLADPLISPVHGDFAGLPPTILTTGTRDILLSDTVRVHRALRAAGVVSQLEVYEAMSHAEYAFAFDSPESATAFGEIAAFFDRYLKA